MKQILLNHQTPLQILEWTKTTKCTFLSSLQHPFAPILINNGKYQSLLFGSFYEKNYTAHAAILLVQKYLVGRRYFRGQSRKIEGSFICKHCCFICLGKNFFLSGFSFRNIHNSQVTRERRRLYLYLLSTTTTRFTNTQTVAGWFLQRAYLCSRQQAESNRKPLVSERKLLNTSGSCFCAFYKFYCCLLTHSIPETRKASLSKLKVEPFFS